MKTKSNKGLVIALILACLLIALVPLFALKGAEFGGSDDAGGDSFSVRQSLIIKRSLAVRLRDYRLEARTPAGSIIPSSGASSHVPSQFPDALYNCSTYNSTASIPP